MRESYNPPICSLARYNYHFTSTEIAEALMDYLKKKEVALPKKIEHKFISENTLIIEAKPK
jgi:hypothetical protein